MNLGQIIGEMQMYGHLRPRRGYGTLGRRALSLVVECQGITASEAAKRLGCTLVDAAQLLRRMMAKGSVRREGTPKHYRYFVDNTVHTVSDE